jgi:hypothetical protein
VFVRKRTVTTIEMHQIVIVRRPGGAAHAWCPMCLKEVEMVSPEEAALLVGVSLLDICRRVGDGDIHFVETANGGLICLNSLLNKVPLGDGRLNPDCADIQSSTSSDLSDAAKPPSSLPHE